MADDITIDLGMDPSAYLAGAQQITQSNSALQQSFGGVAVQASLIDRALEAATPKRAALLAWGGMATAASQTEQALSSLRAQTTTTGASYERLTGSMRSLSREFPIGAAGGRQVIEQFTKMGVAAAGSEARVARLAEATVKLGGANGENVGALAQGMTELARATGNTNLDPKRYEALGDSLTKISATSGASASNILAFSKNIAPMAQSAGLGSTAVLGIASSFARMGEDGVGASTAINKMLTDMSRSVREGTPEIATYAQIVGKTSKEFENLFKQNPAEALNEVTEAISKAGPSGGPRMLEMLGLDGTRTLRSLTALTNQGGTRAAIAEATAAYGSGATQKASDAAFGGLADSFQELNSNSRQLAEAFGTPLLQPLTMFTNALKLPTGMLRGLVESKPVQGGLGALAWGAAGVMGVRALLGPLSGLGLVRQGLTSTPLRALAGAYTQARGIPVAGQGSTFLSRYGAPSRQAAAEGRLGRFATRFWDYGAGYGTAAGPAAPGAGGYSLGDRLRMGLGGAATLAQANLRMIRGQFDNANTSDPHNRRMVGLGMASTPWRGFGNEVRGIWNSRFNNPMSSATPAGPGVANAARQLLIANPHLAAALNRGPMGGLQPIAAASGAGSGLVGASAALKSFQDRLLIAGQNTNVFGRTALATANMLAGGAQFGLRNAGQGAGLIAKGTGSLLNSMGGAVGISMLGGYALWSAAAKGRQSNRDFEAEYGSRDVDRTLNAYRDSIGKATGPAVTHASVVDSMAKNRAATITSEAQAKEITSDDISIAAGRSAPTRTYQGTNAQVASQIRTISPQGLAPDELQAVKSDLLTQYHGNRERVAAILGQVGTGPQNIGSTADMVSSVHAAAGERPKNWQIGGEVMYDAGNLGPKWLSSITGAMAPGGALYKGKLSDTTQESLKSAGDFNQARYGQQRETFGGDYAQQERLKGANAMLRDVAKSGNAEAFDQLAKQLTKDLYGKEVQMTRLDFQKAGGIGQFLANQDDDYAKGYNELRGKMKSAGGEIRADEIQSSVSKNLATVSPMFSKIFDARTGTSAAGAMSTYLQEPGNLGKLDDAADATVTELSGMGVSAQEFASQATKAANNMSSMSPEFAAMQAAMQKFQQKLQFQALGSTPTEARSQQYGFQYGLATQDARNPEQRQQKAAAKQSLLDMADQDKQRMIARLQVQRDYEKQSARSTEDYNLQKEYAEKDYQTSVDRMNRNYTTNRDRQVTAFNLQQTRAEQDFRTQRARQLQAFNISEQRSEQDFNKARNRQLRDYNIGVARQMADFNTQVSRQRRDFDKQENRQLEDYNIARGRQMRDYNIGLQRGEQDYQKSRMRQIRDFNTQMKRAVEDAAKSLMDPYKRIQTQATWDGRNLLVNINEQNAAMTKQLAQLDQMRQKGLSAQAIDQLGLGKVENAQQLNNLTMDAGSNPDLVRQLNEAAAEREKIAAQYQADPSNKEAARAKEDFEKSLKDTEEDYKKSIQRGREDLQRSLDDSAQDFRRAVSRQRADFATTLADQEHDMRKSLARGREDLSKTMADQAADFAQQRARNRADLQRTMSQQEADYRKSMARSSEDFNTALDNAQKDLNTTLGDMEADQTKSLARQKKAHDTSLARMAQDIKDADKTISGDMTTLAESVNAAIHGKAVNWQGILKNDTASWVTDMQKNVIPKVNAVFAAYGIDAFTTSGGVARSSGGGARTVGGRDNAGQRAEGGTIDGFSPHKKADNIPIWATAGEYMQPVDSVNYYGVDTMEKLRRRAIPKEIINGYAEGGLIEFGKLLQKKGYDVSEHPLFGGVHPVHTAGSQHYNRSGPGGGGAIDVNADPFNSPFKNEYAAINQILGLAHQYGLRIIWQQAGHFDHAHFDISANGDMLGDAVKTLAGKRSAAAGVDPNFDQLFSVMSNGKSEVYKVLTAKMKKGVEEAYQKLIAGDLAGDTSAHGASAAANQAIARSLLGHYGFGVDQMPSLVKLWNGESGWNQFADNPSSDAYGIPQALPGSKMAAAGADWKTNPETQIRWGLGYIKDRYGSPNKALAEWNARSPHWYDTGGYLPPGMTTVMNGTGDKEPVLTSGQWQDISTLADLGAGMVNQEQGRALAASNGTVVTVHNNQTYTYDQRNDFSGAEITVQAQDPEEMGRKLEKKAVAGRLTQTRGVRWGQP